MGENKNPFKVENDLKKRLTAKYSSFTFQGTEFDLGPIKIQIHSRIFEEFLKISEADAKETFRSLCLIYLETCSRYKIPCRKSNILILTDDEISRGLQVMVQTEDNAIWNYIFIPPLDLKLLPLFWTYTFFHELGHCWISMERPQNDASLTGFEIFGDLVAICALRRLVPPHTKIYRDILKTRSYVGSMGKKYLDKESYKNILDNPEAYLETQAAELLKDRKGVERWENTKKPNTPESSSMLERTGKVTASTITPGERNTGK